MMNRLPESCVARVLSFTSARDSCRAAAVSATWHSAADSDVVWDRLLPPDHRDILLRAVGPVRSSSKKELYFRLCDSILIDGGKASFELEKSSGKKCFRISARGLKIAWGDTARYWKWKSESNSRFPEVAELMTVCWLEIQCSINARALSPKTTYRAYLIFNITQGSYGLTFPPQESLIKLGSRVSKQNVCLQPDESDPPQPRLTLLGRSASFRVPPRDSGTYGPVKSPCRRDDGWMEVEMGRFFVDEGKEENVDVSMMEVEGGQWKRGLVIQGIELRPTQ